jgi:hypothetical protein
MLSELVSFVCGCPLLNVMYCLIIRWRNIFLTSYITSVDTSVHVGASGNEFASSFVFKFFFDITCFCHLIAILSLLGKRTVALYSHPLFHNPMWTTCWVSSHLPFATCSFTEDSDENAPILSVLPIMTEKNSVLPLRLSAVQITPYLYSI